MGFILPVILMVRLTFDDVLSFDCELGLLMMSLDLGDGPGFDEMPGCRW